jgi:hypothetical protein
MRHERNSDVWTTVLTVEEPEVRWTVNEEPSENRRNREHPLMPLVGLPAHLAVPDAVIGYGAPAVRVS